MDRTEYMKQYMRDYRERNKEKTKKQSIKHNKDYLNRLREKALELEELKEEVKLLRKELNKAE